MADGSRRRALLTRPSEGMHCDVRRCTRSEPPTRRSAGFSRSHRAAVSCRSLKTDERVRISSNDHGIGQSSRTSATSPLKRRSPGIFTKLLDYLPRGNLLDDPVWRRRHTLLLDVRPACAGLVHCVIACMQTAGHLLWIDPVGGVHGDRSLSPSSGSSRCTKTGFNAVGHSAARCRAQCSGTLSPTSPAYLQS